MKQFKIHICLCIAIFSTVLSGCNYDHGQKGMLSLGGSSDKKHVDHPHVIDTHAPLCHDQKDKTDKPKPMTYENLLFAGHKCIQESLDEKGDNDDEKGGNNEPKNVTLVMGPTKSGKSTLIGFLMGAELEKRYTGDIASGDDGGIESDSSYDSGEDGSQSEEGEFYLAYKDGNEDGKYPAIGSKIESATLAPKMFDNRHSNLVICDTAGLFDNRGEMERDFSNDFLDMMLSAGRLNNIVFVIAKDCLTAVGGRTFDDTIEKIGAMIDFLKNSGVTEEVLKDHLFLVVNKCEKTDDKKAVIHKLQEKSRFFSEKFYELCSNIAGLILNHTSEAIDEDDTESNHSGADDTHDSASNDEPEQPGDDTQQLGIVNSLLLGPLTPLLLLALPLVADLSRKQDSNDATSDDEDKADSETDARPQLNSEQQKRYFQDLCFTMLKNQNGKLNKHVITSSSKRLLDDKFRTSILKKLQKTNEPIECTRHRSLISPDSKISECLNEVAERIIAVYEDIHQVAGELQNIKSHEAAKEYVQKEVKSLEVELDRLQSDESLCLESTHRPLSALGRFAFGVFSIFGKKLPRKIASEDVIITSKSKVKKISICGSNIDIKSYGTPSNCIKLGLDESLGTSSTTWEKVLDESSEKDIKIYLTPTSIDGSLEISLYSKKNELKSTLNTIKKIEQRIEYHRDKLEYMQKHNSKGDPQELMDNKMPALYTQLLLAAEGPVKDAQQANAKQAGSSKADDDERKTLEQALHYSREKIGMLKFWGDHIYGTESQNHTDYENIQKACNLWESLLQDIEANKYDLKDKFKDLRF